MVKLSKRFFSASYSCGKYLVTIVFLLGGVYRGSKVCIRWRKPCRLPYLVAACLLPQNNTQNQLTCSILLSQAQSVNQQRLKQLLWIDLHPFQDICVCSWWLNSQRHSCGVLLNGISNCWYCHNTLSSWDKVCNVPCFSFFFVLLNNPAIPSWESKITPDTTATTLQR